MLGRYGAVEDTMKRSSELMAIPAILCFIGLMLWGEQIREFNGFIYFLMILVLGVGFLSGQIQLTRDREKSIADKAVAQFKKENSIPD